MLTRMASGERGFLTSKQAIARLGVKLTTLYAYTSRGLITSVPTAGGRGHLYASDDVERLRARHAARSGHAPVAASALRFGEPVLETRVSQMTPEGPRYRGLLATDLCRAGVSFERVAELLWSGELPSAAAAPELDLRLDARRVWPLFKGRAALPKMACLLGALAFTDEDRHHATDAAEQARARALTRWLASAVAKDPPRERPATPISQTLIVAAGVAPQRERLRGVEGALVLCADHDLNATTFAARVAASAGADLYACLGAALHTLSGSAHGGMCDRIEALLAGIGGKARVARFVRDALARGDVIPGFGHPLYPNGDPRGAWLVEMARTHGARNESARVAFALLDAMARGGHPAPTLDAGLVTLCACLGLPSGTAAAIFALGRTAGWVAHALEQRAAGYLLRPRAHYVGRAARELG